MLIRQAILFKWLTHLAHVLEQAIKENKGVMNYERSHYGIYGYPNHNFDNSTIRKCPNQNNDTAQYI